jgi:hypothetical protein
VRYRSSASTASSIRSLTGSPANVSPKLGQPLEKNLENQLAGDLLHLLMAGPAPLCVVLGSPELIDTRRMLQLP